MEGDGAESQVHSSEGQEHQTETAGSYSETDVPVHPAGSRAPDRMGTQSTPTVLTWQDLTDLPRQILPEETYRHLQNARTEAALALFSLWKNIDKSRRGAAGQPRRKRIEVE